jgi:hypothetical protein
MDLQRGVDDVGDFWGVAELTTLEGEGRGEVQSARCRLTRMPPASSLILRHHGIGTKRGPRSAGDRTEYTRHGAAGQIAVEYAGRPKEGRPPRVHF